MENVHIAVNITGTKVRSLWKSLIQATFNFYIHKGVLMGLKSIWIYQHAGPRWQWPEEKNYTSRLKTPEPPTIFFGHMFCNTYFSLCKLFVGNSYTVYRGNHLLFDYSGKMAVLLLAGLEKLFTVTSMISQLDLLLLFFLEKSLLIHWDWIRINR